MASLAVNPDPLTRFAVYCGSGVYVHSVTNCGRYGAEIVTGGLENSLSTSRRVAIAALHTARRAGLGAWLVQHPDTAGGAL